MAEIPVDTQRVKLINDFLASVTILASVLHERLVSIFKDDLGNELTMSQFKLLRLIAQTRAGRISDVADFLGVTAAAASRAVERLVRRGLIARSPAEDRRVSLLDLTPRGETTLARHEEAHDALLREMIPHVSIEDLRAATQLFDRMSIEIYKHNIASGELCLRCGVYSRDKCLMRSVSGRNCYYHIRRGSDPAEQLETREDEP